MDEHDIWRSAKLLQDQYGPDAVVEAAMRADAMLEAGDLDGQRIWKLVAAAIEELTTGKGFTATGAVY